MKNDEVHVWFDSAVFPARPRRCGVRGRATLREGAIIVDYITSIYEYGLEKEWGNPPHAMAFPLHCVLWVAYGVEGPR